MRLKLLVPTHVVIDEKVTKIIADGEHGSFCLLPRHVDYLAALLPGLLSFTDLEGKEHFAAVDVGILVKRGDEVLISARQATRGTDLEQLRFAVHEEFTILDDRERVAQEAVAKLEASFLRAYLEFAEEQL